VAKAFDITQWPVTAVKAYVGHTIAAASGDQLISSLGTFKYGLIPGIKTISEIAEDVQQDQLTFALKDIDVSAEPMQVAFINSKGFGGNNATAVILSADKTNTMLARRYESTFSEYLTRRECTRQCANDYAEQADKGSLNVIYRFGENLIDERSVCITSQGINIPGFSREIEFNVESSWQDMQ
jgi:acetoacetyl-[acyl-carrier protein] synthase